MWYVVQVFTGREEEMKKLCLKRIPRKKDGGNIERKKDGEAKADTEGKEGREDKADTEGKEGREDKADIEGKEGRENKADTEGREDVEAKADTEDKEEDKQGAACASDETGEGARGAVSGTVPGTVSEEPVLEDCFVPYYEEMKKYNGKWHKEKKVLFPGYVFVITNQIEKLNDELKRMPAFAKILGDWDCLVPLSDSEVAFLCRFGGEDRIVDMSKGIIENDQVKIIEGPMMGMEGCIKRLDRHKRKAQIVVSMFGREMEVTVGVEIISKI